MASITQARCTWSRTDNTISGTIELTVAFTETESRLDLVYRADAVVQPSDESTKGVLYKTIPPLRPGGKSVTINLDSRRNQVPLALSTVRPAGQSSVTVKCPVSISASGLFSEADALPVWTTNPGLDLIRVSLSLDVSTYSQRDNLGPTRLS